MFASMKSQGKKLATSRKPLLSIKLQIFLSANNIMHLKFAWQFAWFTAMRKRKENKYSWWLWHFATGWMICRCWGDPACMSLVVESCMLLRFVWGSVNAFVWAKVCACSKMCPSLHLPGKLPVLHYVKDTEVQLGCKYVAYLFLYYMLILSSDIPC